MSSTVAELAASQGKKIALLTIDPSRRLGTVYNMDLEKDSFKTKKLEKGQIDIYLIHSQQVIAEFITNEWGPEEAQKLSQNKIFKQVATTLSENQSLSTIYKLSQILKGDYDLVIVDTPPAHHAVDFFRSPQSVINLFRDNALAKLISERSKSKWSPQSFFLRVFTFLVGADFLEQMSGFFTVLLKFQEHIVQAAEEIQKLMSSDRACYFMVTLPEPFKVKELAQALTELKKQGIAVKHIIANRAYPLGLDLNSSEPQVGEAADDFKMYYKQQWEYYGSKMDAFYKAINSAQGTSGSTYKIYFVPERTFSSTAVDLEKLGADLSQAFATSEP